MTSASVGSTTCCSHMSRMFCRTLMSLLFGSDFEGFDKEEASGHAKQFIYILNYPGTTITEWISNVNIRYIFLFKNTYLKAIVILFFFFSLAQKCVSNTHFLIKKTFYSRIYALSPSSPQLFAFFCTSILRIIVLIVLI